MSGEFLKQLALPVALFAVLFGMGLSLVPADFRRVLLNPKAKIIVLTAHEEFIYLKRALAFGALGYLSKKSAHQTLHDAVKAVAQKKRFVEPDLSQKLFLSELDGGIDPLEELSAREFGVFLQFAKGLSSPLVAERLNLSESTVSTHLYSIKQKLQLGNQSELILLAHRLGLIHSSES